MADLTIEQALYGSQDAGGYRFLARSPGFLDDWLPAAARLCTGFGERPPGIACRGCVFAHPLDNRHVTIVQVADQGTDDAGRPGALGLHLLVLALADYRDLGSDPFTLAEPIQPPWQARGELPTLYRPAEPPPPRTVEQVRRVLRRPDGPNLLGGSQVLVDGGRLVYNRSTPDAEVVRSLWALLPTSLRGEVWPASFAFGNALGFDVVVLPQAREDECAGYLTEDQAADYPEGRHELSLQVAAESGDQGALDDLFAGRNPRELNQMFAGLSKTGIWVLGLIGLAVFLVLPLFYPLLTTRTTKPATQPTTTSGVATLDLPPADHYPSLNAAERDQLTRKLSELADRLKVPPPNPRTVETLLAALDQHLGTPDSQRNPGPLANQGPPQRQLRVLLWKHNVDEYREPGLNPVELTERLEMKLTPLQP